MELLINKLADNRFRAAIIASLPSLRQINTGDARLVENVLRTNLGLAAVSSYNLLQNTLIEQKDKQSEYAYLYLAATIEKTLEIPVIGYPTSQLIEKLNSPIFGIAARIAFDRIAVRAGDAIMGAVLVGILQGQPLNTILRNLPESPQTKAIVRTLITEVTNDISLAVYAQYPEITQRYQYVATLDTRTSDICIGLDGKTFEYGKGPVPPQHINCRSVIIPRLPGVSLEGTRASKDGPVPASLNYSQWLRGQSLNVQIEALGVARAMKFRQGRPLNELLR
jgi:SPP1 gp7 family putative phage head morphogenesis protein